MRGVIGVGQGVGGGCYKGRYGRGVVVAKGGMSVMEGRGDGGLPNEG